ncbi:MAG: (2Fe-2S)-binding protein [Candidatus Pacebacteria bacterium]|nr:(2Fe-2S)-binding protein [Candidatus Paceibacterota bacterium]
MTVIRLTINQKPIDLDPPGNRLLIETLRDELHLTGTHSGCDTSQCGACLVLIDGQSVKSCSVFTGELDGAAITTIEGLAAIDNFGEGDSPLGRIQTAFQQYHGLQCGFCTSGMVISASELLATTPHPTEAEIRHWLEGNICRCTGYQNIIAAIMAAATGSGTGEGGESHV